MFKLGRTEEAERAYTPGAGLDLMLAILKGDAATARKDALQKVAKWRDAKLLAVDGADLAWINAPPLAHLGLADEAFWILQKANETGGFLALDLLLLDPDLQALRTDSRYEKVLAGSRAYASLFLKHADRAEAQGELPAYLRPSLAELRELLKR